MTRLDYLRDQANRAERLACAVTDALTVTRLASFAADCRREMLGEMSRLIASDPRKDARDSSSPPWSRRATDADSSAAIS
jgi:hypothetical protein